MYFPLQRVYGRIRVSNLTDRMESMNTKDEQQTEKPESFKRLEAFVGSVFAVPKSEVEEIKKQEF